MIGWTSVSLSSFVTITTLIHKYQTTDSENDEFPVLSRNKNIYGMADETHRTQDKELVHNMRTELPNAFYVGFTGTSIEKDKRNTCQTFGNYIDTYTINQSLEDEATVEILYQGRLVDIYLEGSSRLATADLALATVTRVKRRNSEVTTLRLFTYYRDNAIVAIGSSETKEPKEKMGQATPRLPHKGALVVA